MDSKIRILWLSDIHFDKNYKKSSTDFLNLIIERFHEYLKGIEDVEYVLLSGDIGNCAAAEDYSLFNKLILDKILNTLFPNAKLLVVPGNHDVNWSIVEDWKSNNNAFYKRFIENFKKGISEGDTKLRYDFLKSNLSDYKELFKNFKEGFDKFIHKTPQENVLYGCHVDEKNKTVFLLLNSAWYSVTGQLLNLFFDDFFNENPEYNKLETHLKKCFIKDVRAMSDDYGKQLIAFSALDSDFKQKIKNIFENYNDYLILTVTHHPESSLDWDERIGKEEEGEEIDFKFIKKQTSILLTGHEHVPKEFNASYVENGELLHIPGGCFLEHGKYLKNDSSVSLDSKPINYDKWFSVLDINISKSNIKQFKHFFNSESKEWEEFKNEEFKFDKKNHGSISKERKESINKQKLKWSVFKDSNTSKLGDYQVFIKEKALSIEIKSLEGSLSKGSLSSLLNKNNVIAIIEKINNGVIDTIKIVFYDFNHELFDSYDTHIDKLLGLDEVRRDFDFKFDKFRHDFFTSPYVEQELKKRNFDLFNLKIIGIVYPYWKLEEVTL